MKAELGAEEVVSATYTVQQTNGTSHHEVDDVGKLKDRGVD